MSDSKNYVTTDDLFIGADRAHAKGRKVSLTDEQVALFGWGDKLVGENTQAASKARDEVKDQPYPVEIVGVPSTSRGGGTPYTAEIVGTPTHPAVSAPEVNETPKDNTSARKSKSAE